MHGRRLEYQTMDLGRNGGDSRRHDVSRVMRGLLCGLYIPGLLVSSKCGVVWRGWLFFWGVGVFWGGWGGGVVWLLGGRFAARKVATEGGGASFGWYLVVADKVTAQMFGGRARSCLTEKGHEGESERQVM